MTKKGDDETYFEPSFGKVEVGDIPEEAQDGPAMEGQENILEAEVEVKGDDAPELEGDDDKLNVFK